MKRVIISAIVIVSLIAIAIYINIPHKGYDELYDVGQWYALKDGEREGLYLRIGDSIYGSATDDIKCCVKYNDPLEIGRYIIQINNQTKGNCYFWVHPTPVGQIAPQALIKRYFWSAPEGYDFAFGHLITEPNIEFHDCPVILGYNFIKLLSAGESFRLIIPSNNETCTDYTERIVIIPEEELHKYFGEIPDFFLYKDPDYISDTNDLSN